MKVATHIVFAETCWFGACTLFDVGYGSAAVIACAAASVLPDADYPNSWLGHQLGGVSEWLHSKFGHRSFFHSLVALTVFGMFLYLLRVPTPGSWWGRQS